MKKAIILTALALTLNASNSGILSGSGTHTCSKYLDLTEDGNDKTFKIVYNQYLFGVATGISYQSKDNIDPFAKYNINDLQRWIKNYCEANPLELYGNGVYQLLYKLKQ